MLVHANKEIKEVWLGGQEVKEIWIGNTKIFPRAPRIYDLSNPLIRNGRNINRSSEVYVRRDDGSYKLDSDIRDPTAYYRTFFRGNFDVYIDANLGLDLSSGYNALGFYSGEEKFFELRADTFDNIKLIQKGKADITLKNPFSLIKTGHEKEKYRRIRIRRIGTQITIYYYDKGFTLHQLGFETTDKPMAPFIEAKNWNAVYIFSISGVYTPLQSS